MNVRLLLAASACFSLVLAGASMGACGGDPPPPGFQAVGGESADGGAGTGGDATGPTNTTTTTSGPGPSTTTTTSTTSTSTTSTTTTSTSTGGLMCNDDGPGEPNDSEATAVDLGTIDDCNGSGSTVTGLLFGVADVDWYKYQGVDTFGIGCSVDPKRTVTSSDPLTLCKYFQCPDNDETFDCPSGTSPATSPDGRPGCCGDGGFTVGLTCGSSSLNSDDALVYIKLETAVNDCVNYSLSFEY